MNKNLSTPAEDAAADYAKCETQADIVYFTSVVIYNAEPEYVRAYLAEMANLTK